MSTINEYVYRATVMVTDELSDLELSTLYLAIRQGFNPKRVKGYEKAEALFTERDGKGVHDDVLAVLEVIVGERIGGVMR